MKYHRVSDQFFEQKAISERLLHDADGPGTVDDIRRAFEDPSWGLTNDFGRAITITTIRAGNPLFPNNLAFSWSDSGVIKSLRRGHPLILAVELPEGKLMHAFVIIGVERDAFGILERVCRFDPKTEKIEWVSINRLLYGHGLAMVNVKGFLITVFVEEKLPKSAAKNKSS